MALCYADSSMTPEQSANTPQPVTDPEQILSIKDVLVTQWAQLPPEHQATMALFFVHRVFVGQWGDWLAHALDMTAPILPIEVGRPDFESILTPQEIAQLSPQDLRDITQEAIEHINVDWFWKEVEAAARRRLDSDPPTESLP
jgi:hypothetical protein